MISDELKNKICSDYVAGLRLCDISQKYQKDRNTINYILLEAGIYKGTKILSNIPKETIENIKNDLLSKKYHYKDIIIKYNVSIKTILKIARINKINSFKKQKYKTVTFTDNQINHIISSYGKTDTILSLSKKYSCCRQTIKKILINNNIQLLDRPSKNLKAYWKKECIKTPLIIEDYTKNNLSIRQIKSKYKMSFEKIIEIFKNNNIKLKERGFFRKIHFTNDEISTIINMFRDGKPILEICDAFFVCHQTILNILHLNNIKISTMGSPVQNLRRSRSITGKYNNFYFRSMNELSFIINYIEKKNIKYESGENLDGIKYFCSTTNKIKKYYPDLITADYVFELKPKCFWRSQNNIDKINAAKLFYPNKKCIFVDYPVIINNIITKYMNGEIIFNESSVKKFARIYKKYLRCHLKFKNRSYP